MVEKQVFCAIDPINPAADKQQRAQAIQARTAMKMVHFPAFTRWWADAQDQILKFPHGAKDDFVDALALIGLGLAKMHGRTRNKPPEPEIKTGTFREMFQQHAPRVRAATVGPGACRDGRHLRQLLDEHVRRRRRRLQRAGHQPDHRPAQRHSARPARAARAPPAAGHVNWTGKVKKAKRFWKPSFDRMREDQEFAFGKQWSKDAQDTRYVANLTLRLVAQKTAFLYAKNPKAVAKKRQRLNATSWDEARPR